LIRIFGKLFEVLVRMEDGTVCPFTRPDKLGTVYFNIDEVRNILTCLLLRDSVHTHLQST
jgi:hypothetical protein